MKHVVMLSLCLGFFQLVPAQKYVSKNGHIRFYSYTPIEEIEANNRQVVSILDASTGDLQFSLLVKSFEFKIALMQEHFNENYMESDKFPKASFKGTIANMGQTDLKKDGIYPVEVTGNLTIHGVTRALSTQGTLEVKNGTVSANARLSVSPKDYEIKIPSLVADRIARSVEVTVNVTYVPNP